MNSIEIMARTIYGEAKANDILSATSIAHVIMNRVDLRNWPSTIEGVCLQPWQFSCWNQNDPNRIRIMNATMDNEWFAKCYEIAEIVSKRTAVDKAKNPAGGKRATHYHTPAVSPKWSKGKKPCFVHAHLYYNDIDTPPPVTAADALEIDRPLNKTRTVQGGKIGMAGVTGAGLLMELQEQIEPLIPYSEYMKYVFLGVAVIGIGVMIWARISDRREGLR